MYYKYLTLMGFELWPTISQIDWHWPSLHQTCCISDIALMLIIMKIMWHSRWCKSQQATKLEVEAWKWRFYMHSFKCQIQIPGFFFYWLHGTTTRFSSRASNFCFSSQDYTRNDFRRSEIQKKKNFVRPLAEKEIWTQMLVRSSSWSAIVAFIDRR